VRFGLGGSDIAPPRKTSPEGSQVAEIDARRPWSATIHNIKLGRIPVLFAELRCVMEFAVLRTNRAARRLGTGDPSGRGRSP
jgi:hypothetical protein